jgi:hypothetical protein
LISFGGIPPNFIKNLLRRADLRRFLSAASVRRRAGRTPNFSRRRRRVKYGSALGRRRRAPIGFGHWRGLGKGFVPNDNFEAY